MAKLRTKPLSTNPGTVAARKHQAKVRARRQALFADAEKMAQSNDSMATVVAGLADGDVTAGELAAHISREVRRDAVEVTRGFFTSKVAERAEAIAEKMVDVAVEGDTAALICLAKLIMPMPKPTGTKINLGIDRLETDEDVRGAELSVIQAQLNGRITVEEGEALLRSLVMVSAEVTRRQDQEMRRKLQEALLSNQEDGVLARVRGPLTLRAQQVLTLIENGELYAPAVTVIEAEVVEAEDADWQDFA